MATTVDYIEYVCEQMPKEYSVRYKKMFGEYMVYINDKPMFLVCDNTVYVKKLDVLKDIMRNADIGVPYNGAKEHYIVDIEDHEIIYSVVKTAEPLIPLPKKKH